MEIRPDLSDAERGGREFFRWMREHPEEAQASIERVIKEQRKKAKRYERERRSECFWRGLRKVADIAAVVAALAGVATVVLMLCS